VSEPITEAADQAEPQDTPAAVAPATLVEDDLLVEDISIDGMCGVY
jgi:mycofactocin precursor